MSDMKQTIDAKAATAQPGAERLSAILEAIAATQDKERISIGDLLQALHRRR